MPSMDPGALRAVKALVDTHLDQLASDDKCLALTPITLDAQVETGAFPPDIARLMSSVNTIPLREGLIIQGALHIAHCSAPQLWTRRNLRCTVTQTDRALVAGNEFGDLTSIAPPAAGEPAGRHEIDLLVYNEGSNILRLIDVKRAPRSPDHARRFMAEADLAMRRLLSGKGAAVVRTEIFILRWLADPEEAHTHRYVTRETVDEALGLPVRALVDAGVRHFREGLEMRFGGRRQGSLWTSYPPATRPSKPAAHRPTGGDPASREALSRIFGKPRRRPRGM